MAEKNTAGNWIDSRGNPVPPKYIDPIDKKRDQLVEWAVKNATQINKKMTTFKTELERRKIKFLEQSAASSGVTVKPGQKNLTLQNFSYTKKVEISEQIYLDYSEKIKMAVELFLECIEEWTSDRKGPVEIIIKKIFKPNKKGQLNIKGLKSLKELKINNPKWKKAIELLNDAEKIVSSKEYYRFYTKDLARTETISLDFANIEPLPDPF